MVTWSLVPNESAEAFAFVYNGVREAFFSVLKPGTLRLCPPGQGCELCDQIRDLQSSPEVAEVLADPSRKLPVKKAGSDNTTKWSKSLRLRCWTLTSQ
jgi:hypothetical protein